jgi:endoglucanase
VAKNNGGYTGNGFIDFQAASGEHLNWLIQTKTAGKHTLIFRYALGGGNRPLQLKVNDKVTNKALPFTDSGGWTSWKTITTTASLKAGVNDIRLESTGSSGPNIDNLTIERN